MVPTLFLIAFLFIFLLVIAAKSLRVAKPDELLVIFRLEKCFAVYGPGWSVVIPFIDRVVKIKVEEIPNWQKLSETELQLQAAEIAVKGKQSQTYIK
jgi:regulator of protease activity HflC (stomatin/prohibitin superfamily)